MFFGLVFVLCRGWNYGKEGWVKVWRQRLSTASSNCTDLISISIHSANVRPDTPAAQEGTISAS